MEKETALAVNILHWAKENGFEYNKYVWVKENKYYSAEELYNEFKIVING